MVAIYVFSTVSCAPRQNMGHQILYYKFTIFFTSFSFRDDDDDDDGRGIVFRQASITVFPSSLLPNAAFPV